MRPVEGILSSAAQRSERASDRTAAKNWHGRSTDVEIEHLRKLLRDLRTGMVNLRALRPAPHALEARILAQAGKIRSVELKLFRLRQGMLL